MQHLPASRYRPCGAGIRNEATDGPTLRCKQILNMPASGGTTPGRAFAQDYNMPYPAIPCGYPQHHPQKSIMKMKKVKFYATLRGEGLIAALPLTPSC